MRWADDLHELTDDATIKRGIAYAEAGRVTDLREQVSGVSARVIGSLDYQVELTADTWFCDCPVGVTGDFCKHCVAVAVEASGRRADANDDEIDLTTSDTKGAEAFDGKAWLQGLSAEDLRTLLAQAVVQVAGMAEFVARAQIVAEDDLVALAKQVRDTFTPRRRSYDYQAANDYAVDIEHVVGLLEDRSMQPGDASLLLVLQKAIDLTVRAMQRSDDSSGLQGIQLGRLQDAHERVAAQLRLPRPDAKKLVKWLFTFVVDRPDFGPMNIDRYAETVGPEGVEDYRRLVDKAAEDQTASFTVDHARGRLAILSRDLETIVAHFGANLGNAYMVTRLVEALDEAGHHDAAAVFARQGIEQSQSSPYLKPLVERAVDDARQRGAFDEIVALRRDLFQRQPSTTTFVALQRDAEAAGVWDDERPGADELLARVDPQGWILMLLKRGDDGAAWEAAVAHPDRVDVKLWERLFRVRVKIDPASTLPKYRRLIDATLVTADRQNYQTAARLLRGMRDAAGAAGQAAEFGRFLVGVAERNRRRPAFQEELYRAGLRP